MSFELNVNFKPTSPLRITILAALWFLASNAALAWPDLAVTKTGPATASINDTITYSLVYTNQGGATAYSVTVTDAVPSQLSIITNSLTGATISGANITWNIGTLCVGNGGRLTFQAQVKTSATPGQSVTNNACIQSATAEDNNSNNSSKAITRIVSISLLTNQTVCPSSSATFSTSILGLGMGSYSYTYQWYKGATALTGKTSNTLVLTGVSSADAGSYSVVASGMFGARLTNSATLTVNAPVTVSGMADLTRTTGSSATFSPVITGTGPLTYVWKKNGAVITGQTNATLTLAPVTSSMAGTYSIEVTGACGMASASAALIFQNTPPVAVNDSYSTPQGVALNIALPGVLANDSDVDGDPLTAILVSNPTHGTLTLNGNGSFLYTPAANYFGPDSFTYKANDGQANSGVATVSLTVTHVNHAPVAANDAYSTPQDTALNVSAPGVLGNDSDPDGDALTAMLVSNPSHGTLTLNGNGSFVYTPASGYSGGDSFTYKDSDGQTNSGVATVTLTVVHVNHAPIAVNDSYYTPQDTALNVGAPGVLSNDSDPDGDALTAVLLTRPTHGTLTFNSNGSLLYTPTTGYFGPDSFTYRASDGQTNSAAATVSLTVLHVNHPPVAVNDSYTTTQDTPLNVSAPGVLGNDSDPDGDLLNAVLVSGPSHGTLTLNSAGSFLYTPSSGYTGSDSFTYMANDGQANSGVATVTISIIRPNRPPVAVNDSYSTPQNTVLNVVAPGVLANDSDPDGDALTAVLAGNPAHGVLALNATGSFRYTPATGYTGADSFTYRASDGQTNSAVATVSLTVTPTARTNQPPTVVIFSPTNGSVFLAPAAFTLFADARDSDGTISKVEFYSGAAKIGETTNVVYFSTNMQAYALQLTNLPPGTDVFTAIATDNEGATGTSAPVTITVLARPPLQIVSSIVYDPLTDLFEETVRVTNPTFSTYNAVRVYAANLVNNTIVYNASGSSNGVSYVQTYNSVPPGSTVDLLIEYYSPTRTMPNPALSAELVQPDAGASAALFGAPQKINRGLMLQNKTFMVEFMSAIGVVYSIEYSSDLKNWKSAQPSINGNGTWIQWIDNGQPKTESLPSATASRFYKVILLP